ncbi:MAG TPA: oligosaccharide flippase family protein [Allosphingosinicella sp.]
MTVQKAARAGAWSAIDTIMRQGVSFVVLMVLARLLTPADFGVVALAAFFSSLSIVFVQGGLSQALLQHKETSREQESAVFWWNLGGSLLCAGLLMGIAPFVARFYGYPLLVPLMFMAAGQVVFAAFGAVQTSLLTRALRFDRLALAGTIASIASGAIGIVAALQGLGAWALALQLASLAAVNSALLWGLSGWRPVFHARFATMRGIFESGIYLSLSGALDVVYTQGFSAIIGKLYGAGDLGLYNRAYSTQALPGGVLGSVVARTSLPLFVARIGDDDALRRAMRMANSLAMILNVPAMIGLAILSDLVIVTLFGDQWVPAAPILAVLAIAGILLPLHLINLQLLLALAQSRLFFRNEVIKKLAAASFVVVGSFFGVMGLAWATVLFSGIGLWINSHAARSTLGYGPALQLWDLKGLIIPSAAMVALVLLLRPYIPFSPPVSLGVLAAAGALVYFGVGLALRSRSFLDATTFATSLWKREAPLEAPASDSGPPQNLL